MENNKKKENQEIIERINQLKKKIMIFEWDKEKNQLNPGKATYLTKIKEELKKLEHELNNLGNEDLKQKEESE